MAKRQRGAGWECSRSGGREVYAVKLVKPAKGRNREGEGETTRNVTPVTADRGFLLRRGTMPPKKPAAKSKAGGSSATKSATVSAARPRTTGNNGSHATSASSGPPPPPAVDPEHIAGLEEWDNITRKKWRGLGLTDPIKSVEV